MVLVIMTLTLGYYGNVSSKQADSMSNGTHANSSHTDETGDASDDTHTESSHTSETNDTSDEVDTESSHTSETNDTSDETHLEQSDTTEISHTSDQIDYSASGQLAYIGNDGNVYITTADRSSKTAITTDATTGPEDAGFSYHRISWSPDGKLAFAGVHRNADQASAAKLYVTALDGQPARLIGENENHFVIYIYWSPVACPERPDCRQLAYLIEEEEDIALRLVELEGENVNNQVIGEGWPFYYSWHPDGQSILWHTGGAERYYGDKSTLAHYQLANGEQESLDIPLGLFFAPAWSPKGDKWLAVSAEDGDTDSLRLFEGEENTILDSALDSQVMFSWSPDGSKVAYARRENDENPFFSPVHIYDIHTKESKRLTDIDLRIQGFFWSPSGDRLAYLTWLPLPNATWTQWRVYNLENDIDRGFKTFNPSPQMNFMMSSFNQYAQSHRFWSPDGRYLVYANRDEKLIDRVWIIDTLDNEDGTEVTQIGYGSFGTWSWE